jgi:hypothetical protein
MWRLTKLAILAHLYIFHNLPLLGLSKTEPPPKPLTDLI